MIDIERLLEQIKAPVLKWINNAVESAASAGVDLSGVAYLARIQTFTQHQNFSLGIDVYGSGTNDAAVNVGAIQTSDHNAYVDLTSDSTYTDYGLRLIKHAGANARGELALRGTGDFWIHTQEASGVIFKTSGLERMRISATEHAVEIGQNSGSHDAYIDLRGDDTYTDYGLRMLRAGGADSLSEIVHRGTAVLRLKTSEAAPISFDTSGTARVWITPTGAVGIGTVSPASAFEIAALSNTGYITGNEITYSGTPAANKAALYVADYSGTASWTVKGDDGVAFPLRPFVASGASHAPGLVPDPPGSSGSTKFLREDATWAVPSGGSGSGVLVQKVSTLTGTLATGTTTIPLDNTKPQNTEGDEYMTRAITPTDANNILYITVTFIAAYSAISGLTAALFKDSGADAIASGICVLRGANDLATITFTHTMVAGSTSSMTFKVRGGGNAAGTLSFNGQSGSGIYNGVLSSSIVIEECTP